MTSNASALSGVLHSRSLTNSKPMNNPAPRTSPTQGYFAASVCSSACSRLPTSRLWAWRPSRAITSSTTRAAGHHRTGSTGDTAAGPRWRSGGQTGVGAAACRSQRGSGQGETRHCPCRDAAVAARTNPVSRRRQYYHDAGGGIKRLGRFDHIDQ